MSNKANAGWSPYTIPATPTINNNDVYALSCSNGADSSNNPSQYLEWKKTIPNGERVGDLLRWDGSAWVLLPAISSGSLHVLTIKNNVLAWTPTEDCE
jgi:hypothetical protein